MEAILSQKKAVAGYAAAFGAIGTIGGRSLPQSMPDGIASPLGDGAFWRDRTSSGKRFALPHGKASLPEGGGVA
ncbi:MAG: hypothetical protein EGQ68_05730, partial [Faecalibacterium sp.]|nr:hypothetical protein [Faecalibacterium sp.]